MNVHITNHLKYAKAKTDGGIGEGHDSGDDGKPPNLVEVWNLREKYLYNPEDNHVRGAWDMAGVIMAFLMETVRSPDGSVHKKQPTLILILSFHCKNLTQKEGEKRYTYVILIEEAMV